MNDRDHTISDELTHEKEGEGHIHEAPGTAILVLILLVTFIVYYFANWKALSDVWQVR